MAELEIELNKAEAEAAEIPQREKQSTLKRLYRLRKTGQLRQKHRIEHRQNRESPLYFTGK